MDLKDVGLSFFVRYMSNHLDMIWDSVATQPKDSHGMIGMLACVENAVKIENCQAHIHM